MLSLSVLDWFYVILFQFKINQNQNEVFYIFVYDLIKIYRNITKEKGLKQFQCYQKSTPCVSTIGIDKDCRPHVIVIMMREYIMGEIWSTPSVEFGVLCLSRRINSSQLCSIRFKYSDFDV